MPVHTINIGPMGPDLVKSVLKDNDPYLVNARTASPMLVLTQAEGLRSQANYLRDKSNETMDKLSLDSRVGAASLVSFVACGSAALSYTRGTQTKEAAFAQFAAGAAVGGYAGAAAMGIVSDAFKLGAAADTRDQVVDTARESEERASASQSGGARARVQQTGSFQDVRGEHVYQSMYSSSSSRRRAAALPSAPAPVARQGGAAAASGRKIELSSAAYTDSVNKYDGKKAFNNLLGNLRLNRGDTRQISAGSSGHKIMEIRAKNGSRIYYTQDDDSVKILGKSMKNDQQAVIDQIGRNITRDRLG